MVRDDVLTLIGEDPTEHGVFETVYEPRTQVFCKVQSVSRTEYWRALSNGIEPSFAFTLSEYVDYHGEKIVEYHGKRYRVIRTYVTDNSIELECGEVTDDA